jgi:signal transduction histidine kinase
MFKRVSKLRLALAPSKFTLLVLIAALPVLFPPVAAAAETPKKILIFSGVDPRLPGNILVDENLRTTLEKGFPGRVQYYSEALDNSRIPADKFEPEMIRYLQRKYEGEKLDLIFAIGSGSLKFLLKHKDEIFSNTPTIFVHTTDRQLEGLELSRNVTGVQGRIELKPALDLALSLQPGTRRVVVVTGNSSQDKLWERVARDEFESDEGKLEFNYLTNVTMEELRNQLASLPSDTIVLFLNFLLDAGGNAYSTPEAVSLVAPSSSAPIYVSIQSAFKPGVVGGRLISYEALGKAGAELGLRVLAGERPNNIAPQTLPNVAMFNWRELRRWGIDESRLPAGSIVVNKEFSVWELYKWRIIGVLALCALQALLIAVLLVERRKRQRAIIERERAGEELQKTRNDLAHVARLTAMGEMAASIAHEVNQPLAAIATYGDACVLLLSGESPNVKKSLEAIDHIIKDSIRASEVVKRIRTLVKKTSHEMTPQDLNQIIREMVAVTEADVLRKSIQLALQLDRDLPSVLGDGVELQQVVLNLILNGIEAMSDITDRARELMITSSMNGGRQVVVAVQDSGVGLNSEQQKRAFDPFVTTKPSGLGLGLSISRTILEGHGGRLWAEPNKGPGAKFQFTLPTAGGE